MVFGVTAGGVGRAGEVKPPMPHMLPMFGREMGGKPAGEEEREAVWKLLNMGAATAGGAAGAAAGGGGGGTTAWSTSSTGRCPRLAAPMPTPVPTLPPMVRTSEKLIVVPHLLGNERNKLVEVQNASMIKKHRIKTLPKKLK